MTETNVILVEEAEQDYCTRSTIAYNAARAYADAVIIIAKEGEKELVAAIDSKSAVAQQETLQLEHVSIPVGVVTFEDGSWRPLAPACAAVSFLAAILHALLLHDTIVCCLLLYTPRLCGLMS